MMWQLELLLHHIWHKFLARMSTTNKSGKSSENSKGLLCVSNSQKPWDDTEFDLCLHESLCGLSTGWDDRPHFFWITQNVNVTITRKLFSDLIPLFCCSPLCTPKFRRRFCCSPRKLKFMFKRWLHNFGLRPEPTQRDSLTSQSSLLLSDLYKLNECNYKA